eukprot:gene17992-21545_t
MKEEAAASVIQSHYRRHREMNTMHKAATTIQARFKGFNARRKFHCKESATIKMQALAKGNQIRKRYSKLIIVGKAMSQLLGEPGAARNPQHEAKVSDTPVSRHPSSSSDGGGGGGGGGGRRGGGGGGRRGSMHGKQSKRDWFRHPSTIKTGFDDAVASLPEHLPAMFRCKDPHQIVAAASYIRTVVVLRTQQIGCDAEADAEADSVLADRGNQTIFGPADLFNRINWLKVVVSISDAINATFGSAMARTAICEALAAFTADSSGCRVVALARTIIHQMLLCASDASSGMEAAGHYAAQVLSNMASATLAVRGSLIEVLLDDWALLAAAMKRSHAPPAGTEGSTDEDGGENGEGDNEDEKELLANEIELRQCYREQKRVNCFEFLSKLAQYVGFVTADHCLGALGGTLLGVLTSHDEELIPMASAALEALLLTSYGSAEGIQVRKSLENAMGLIYNSKRTPEDPLYSGTLSRLAHLATTLKLRDAADCSAADTFGNVGEGTVGRGITMVRSYVAVQLQEASIANRKLFGHLLCGNALETAFIAMNKAGTDFFNRAEFASLMKRLDIPLTEKQLKVLFEDLDESGDDLIEVGELESLFWCVRTREMGRDLYASRTTTKDRLKRVRLLLKTGTDVTFDTMYKPFQARHKALGLMVLAAQIKDVTAELVATKHVIHPDGVHPTSVAIQDDTMQIELNPNLRNFAGSLQSDLNKWIGSRALSKIKCGLQVDGKNVVFNTAAGPVSFASVALLAGVVLDGVVLNSDAETSRLDKLETEDGGLTNFSDAVFTPMLSQEAVLQGALEHMVRAATLRNREAIAKLSAKDAQRFGRWCAIPVLLYTLSSRCARSGTQYIRDCLDVIDSFTPATPQVRADFQAKLLKSAVDLDREDESAVQDLYVLGDASESRWWVRSYALMAWQNGVLSKADDTGMIAAAAAAKTQDAVAAEIHSSVAQLLESAMVSASKQAQGRPESSGGRGSSAAVGDLFGAGLVHAVRRKAENKAHVMQSIASLKETVVAKEAALHEWRHEGARLRKHIGNLEIALVATGISFSLQPVGSHSILSVDRNGKSGVTYNKRYPGAIWRGEAAGHPGAVCKLVNQHGTYLAVTGNEVRAGNGDVRSHVRKITHGGRVYFAMGEARVKKLANAAENATLKPGVAEGRLVLQKTPYACIFPDETPELIAAEDESSEDGFDRPKIDRAYVGKIKAALNTSQDQLASVVASLFETRKELSRIGQALADADADLSDATAAENCVLDSINLLRRAAEASRSAAAQGRGDGGAAALGAQAQQPSANDWAAVLDAKGEVGAELAANLSAELATGFYAPVSWASVSVDGTKGSKIPSADRHDFTPICTRVGATLLQHMHERSLEQPGPTGPPTALINSGHVVVGASGMWQPLYYSWKDYIQEQTMLAGDHLPALQRAVEGQWAEQVRTARLHRLGRALTETTPGFSRYQDMLHQLKDAVDDTNAGEEDDANDDSADQSGGEDQKPQHDAAAADTAPAGDKGDDAAAAAAAAAARRRRRRLRTISSNTSGPLTEAALLDMLKSGVETAPSFANLVAKLTRGVAAEVAGPKLSPVSSRELWAVFEQLGVKHEDNPELWHCGDAGIDFVNARTTLHVDVGNPMAGVRILKRLISTNVELAEMMHRRDPRLWPAPHADPEIHEADFGRTDEAAVADETTDAGVESGPAAESSAGNRFLHVERTDGTVAGATEGSVKEYGHSSGADGVPTI